MQCKHPMGFILVIAPFTRPCCFDCKTSSPGKCVCGAWYRSAPCMLNAHLRGPQLIEEAA